MNHLTKAECTTISIVATALAVCIVSHNILKISQTNTVYTDIKDNTVLITQHDQLVNTAITASNQVHNNQY